MVLGRGQQWPVSLNCKFIVDAVFLHSQAQTGANSIKHFELVKDSEDFELQDALKEQKINKNRKLQIKKN